MTTGFEKMRAGRYFLMGVALVFTVIAADQYVKWLIMETVLRGDGGATASFYDWFLTRTAAETFLMETGRFKTLQILPFLDLVMVWNKGVSFGLFSAASSQLPLLFIVFSLGVSAALLIWLALAPRKGVAIALSLVIGGALANVMDRVRFGAVVDFIDVYAGAYHWPAFNVADACIVIGAGLLMLLSLRDGKEEKT